jgi:thiamine-monophosphate kinase
MSPIPPAEFAWIARYLAPLSRSAAFQAFDLTDDAAILAPRPGNEFVVTADALVAEVHFRAADPLDLVACKALRTNLSDLAAKGASAVAYFLSVAWPRGVSSDDMARFVDGLARDQASYGIGLAGGDTTTTGGPLTIAITAIGEVPIGTMIRRAGANAGDDVWVSGTIGDGALGLRAISGELPTLDATHRGALANRYLLPRPRTILGPRLRGVASAALDVSDGLVQDLGHIAALASCGAVINRDAVPFSAAASAAIADDQSLCAVALGGGDDYEIAFTASPSQRETILRIARECEVACTRIGALREGTPREVVLRDGDGRESIPARGGWSHF